MTRINVTVKPFNLMDGHLVAAYRETGRVSAVYKYRVDNGIPLDDIPSKFRLGAGHVKFFLNKPMEILTQFEALTIEMQKRGYATNIPISYIVDNFGGWGNISKINCDYEYSQEDKNLIRERIIERLPAKPRYYSKEVSKEFMINLIRQ